MESNKNTSFCDEEITKIAFDKIDDFMKFMMKDLPEDSDTLFSTLAFWSAWEIIKREYQRLKKEAEIGKK